jgi:hypothetical protein
VLKALERAERNQRRTVRNSICETFMKAEMAKICLKERTPHQLFLRLKSVK